MRGDGFEISASGAELAATGAEGRRVPGKVTVGLRPEHFTAPSMMSRAGRSKPCLAPVHLEVDVAEYIGSSQFLAARDRRANRSLRPSRSAPTRRRCKAVNTPSIRTGCTCSIRETRQSDLKAAWRDTPTHVLIPDRGDRHNEKHSIAQWRGCCRGPWPRPCCSPCRQTAASANPYERVRRNDDRGQLAGAGAFPGGRDTGGGIHRGDRHRGRDRRPPVSEAPRPSAPGDVKVRGRL